MSYGCTEDTDMTNKFARVGTMGMLALALSAASCGDAVSAAFVGDTAWILDRPDQLEFLTLDPSHEPPAYDSNNPERLHGYLILGSAVIRDAALQKELVDSVKDAVKGNTGIAAACFNPRHAIRATRGGKSVDMLICFQCLQMEVYQGAKWKMSLISSTQKELFTQVAAQMKLPVATQPAE
jgi:hypothetical protein